MKKYLVRLSCYEMNPYIEEVEVDRETTHFVYIGKDRTAKISMYENYFDTWKEAQAALMDKQIKKRNSLQLDLERNSKIIEHIKGLKQK